LRVASKELYATGETKECLKAQQVPCPYRANEKPPAKLVDIYCIGNFSEFPIQ
ncbi:MAG TPA: hypothetical protein GXX16_13635, partial [Epulopiscium sp.]|nr:hypothetical protein [Candidatus Epulonipiscium sp.]